MNCPGKRCISLSGSKDALCVCVRERRRERVCVCEGVEIRNELLWEVCCILEWLEGCAVYVCEREEQREREGEGGVCV